jgi:general transcription factor 3C polypeptide 3 (transcription factor C subunit 4)
MGTANMCYVSKRYEEAIQHLLDVIRHAPNSHEPYRILALIYEEKNEIEKAISYYLIAAHLTPKDAELWKRLAAHYTSNNHFDQAIYCYSKAAKADFHDAESLWQKAFLYLQLGEVKKAANTFSEILRVRPGDLQVLKEAAKLYVQVKEVQKAIDVFIESMDHPTARYTLTYSHINILAELLMMKGDYEAAISHIKFYCIVLVNSGSQSRINPLEVSSQRQMFLQDSIPPEIKAKFIVCHALMLLNDECKVLYDEFAGRIPVSEVPDLFYDIAEALFESGNYGLAYTVYKALLTVSEVS